MSGSGEVGACRTVWVDTCYGVISLVPYIKPGRHMPTAWYPGENGNDVCDLQTPEKCNILFIFTPPLPRQSLDGDSAGPMLGLSNIQQFPPTAHHNSQHWPETGTTRHLRVAPCSLGKSVLAISKQLANTTNEYSD